MVLSQLDGGFTPVQGRGKRGGELSVRAVGGVGREALLLRGLATG